MACAPSSLILAKHFPPISKALCASGIHTAMELKEQYSDQARIQLNFASFMVIAIWVCFGVALAFGVAFHLVISNVFIAEGSEGTIFILSTLMYSTLGFIFSLIGSAAIYPFYELWCENMRGQSVKGKFAFISKGT